MCEQSCDATENPMWKKSLWSVSALLKVVYIVSPFF